MDGVAEPGHHEIRLEKQVEVYVFDIAGQLFCIEPDSHGREESDAREFAGFDAPGQAPGELLPVDIGKNDGDFRVDGTVQAGEEGAGGKQTGGAGAV